ncbi:hypothetical protein FVF58_10430 [Paraburkholderia panacisoli]|uniref:Uncharacterized protein n=1 Tax=Paraburkholderia panacisoli TaxID=2603818 RepID=A0A5B0HD65_9BURK|nr:hypothetical protein [Paraburkholderia panacisoli]KAA1013175.1 hypothetical protein FVF58_10430 [Paraburkholderia panacisoli]
MSPELEAKLRADYPLIFTAEPIGDPDDPDVPAVLTLCATWGFECGDGWYDLIDVLCLNLQYATKNGAPQVVARQVKEKFGGLRFYAGGPNDEQAGMIQVAASMSTRLCEVCGNRGKLVRNGWIKTRCAEHENADNE